MNPALEGVRFTGKSQQWIFETLHNLESPNKAIRDQSEAQLAQLPSLID